MDCALGSQVGGPDLGADVDVAVPLVQKAQARYSALRACSFDRGFHSPDNRVGLDALLDLSSGGHIQRRRDEEPRTQGSRGDTAQRSPHFAV